MHSFKVSYVERVESQTLADDWPLRIQIEMFLEEMSLKVAFECVEFHWIKVWCDYWW